jgi:hypothetical protein
MERASFLLSGWQRRCPVSLTCTARKGEQASSRASLDIFRTSVKIEGAKDICLFDMRTHERHLLHPQSDRAAQAMEPEHPLLGTPVPCRQAELASRLRFGIGAAAMKIHSDEWLVTGYPGIVPGWDRSHVTRTNLALYAIVHPHHHLARDHIEQMGHLTTVGAGDRFDALRPTPTRRRSDSFLYRIQTYSDAVRNVSVSFRQFAIFAVAVSSAGKPSVADDNGSVPETPPHAPASSLHPQSCSCPSPGTPCAKCG